MNIKQVTTPIITAWHNAGQLIRKVLPNISLERSPANDIYIKNHNMPDIRSNTFYRLSSPQFRVPENIAENNSRITTVIDKKTGAHVKVFVAKVEAEEPNCERYIIMKKNPNGDIKIAKDNYECIGSTYFYINPEEQMITPKIEFFTNQAGINYQKINSYVKATGNNEYAGIGTRLMQLRVESMLLNNLNNVKIAAEGMSFPFHYGLGFRIHNFRDFSNAEEFLKHLSGFNGKSIQENSKYLVIKKEKGEQYVHILESLQKFLNDYYKNGGKELDYMPDMYLTDKALIQWCKLIQQQPIIL